MPSSWPSIRETEAHPIEVLDPVGDRDGSPERSPLGAGKRLWAGLGAVALVAALLTLLPDAANLPPQVDTSLPVPVVATTSVAGNRVMLATISEERWPLRFVSGLDGFLLLAAPTRAADGTWWTVGNDAEATFLSSTDGLQWHKAGEVPNEGDAHVWVNDLTMSDGALIAVGGTRMVSDGKSIVRLQSWRSSDGGVWIPGLVTEGLAFADIDVIADRATILVAFRDGNGAHRLFRSTSFSHWEEADYSVASSRDILRAPQGGFMVSAGMGDVYTSAYGDRWTLNPAFDPGFYTQWGERVVGVTREEEPALRIISETGRDTIKLPPELSNCDIKGGEPGLLAICHRSASFDLYLSSDGLLWSRAGSEVLTDDLTFIGSTSSGFLVATEDRRDNMVVALAGS